MDGWMDGHVDGWMVMWMDGWSHLSSRCRVSRDFLQSNFFFLFKSGELRRVLQSAEDRAEETGKAIMRGSEAEKRRLELAIRTVSCDCTMCCPSTSRHHTIHPHHIITPSIHITSSHHPSTSHDHTIHPSIHPRQRVNSRRPQRSLGPSQQVSKSIVSLLTFNHTSLKIGCFFVDQIFTEMRKNAEEAETAHQAAVDQLEDAAQGFQLASEIRTKLHQTEQSLVAEKRRRETLHRELRCDHPSIHMTIHPST